MEKDFTKTAEYTSANIDVLEGLEPVRKRPGMYIGDSGKIGLHHLIWEIIDNSVDEGLGGHCSEIFLTISHENVITVCDNGRGIPVDINKIHHRPGVEIVFNVLHSGGKFNNKNYQVSGGLHGVGASVVNALSEFVKVKVFKSGYEYEQIYENGGKTIHPLKKIGKTTKRGTIVVFKPDLSYFSSEAIFDEEFILSRLKNIAYLNPNLTIHFTFHEKDEIIYHFPNGILDFLKDINSANSQLTKVIYYQGDKNISVSNELRSLKFELAFNYVVDDNSRIYSFCNSINTSEGGKHLDGFKRGIFYGFKRYIRAVKISENDTEKFVTEDVINAVYAIISVKHPAPYFSGQTKRFLSNSDIGELISKTTSDNFFDYLMENKEGASIIVERISQSRQARIEAKKARDIVNKKNKQIGKGLPGKLADCSNDNPAECELFLVEGESAGGSAKLGRNREFQAILALKGKVINCIKNEMTKILENEEIENLITAIGCGISINNTFDLNNLRYHKIIIMTDADVDGSHIRMLILTFIYRLMPELIANGNIFVAFPPLYKAVMNRKIYYFYTDNELEKFKATQKKNATISIQRYKGLGEMNPRQLWETTMDPSARIIKQITISDESLAGDYFERFLGKNPEMRRDYIYENAHFAKNLDV